MPAFFSKFENSNNRCFKDKVSPPFFFFLNKILYFIFYILKSKQNKPVSRIKLFLKKTLKVGLVHVLDYS